MRKCGLGFLWLALMIGKLQLDLFGMGSGHWAQHNPLPPSSCPVLSAATTILQSIQSNPFNLSLPFPSLPFISVHFPFPSFPIAHKNFPQNILPHSFLSSPSQNMLIIPFGHKISKNILDLYLYICLSAIPFFAMDSVAFASSNGDGRGQMDGPTQHQQLSASQYSPPPPPPCSSPIPDIFSTIRRHCERHLCRLERYKKGGAIFAEDQGEKEKPEEMSKNGITKNNEVNNSSSSSSKTTEQQFGELHEKMIVLVENDMALLVKLLSLGDSLRELRQRTQHHHHQQHQLQQQNPAAEMKANEEEEEEERPPRHKTIMAEWEEEEEQHGNADDDNKCQKPMNEKRGNWEKKKMMNGNGNVPFPSSSSGRVLPPPFMGGGRRQRRQPRNPIPAEFVGEEITRLYVWDDEEEDEEDEEEEEKEYPSQTVQYFSRKNSVLRIPIPPRSSNRAFANRRSRQHPPKCPPPHFVRNANNHGGGVSSPAISTEIGAPVSPVIELDSGHSSASEHSPIPPPTAADHHLCSSSSPPSSHPSSTSSIGQSCCFSTISSSTQSSMSFGSSTTEMANIGHNQHLNQTEMNMKKCTLNE